MNIIEQSVRGKHSIGDCEDGLVITADFVAVIDGSTSKSRNQIHPSMKNGRYAMRLISDFIREMPAEISLGEFCDTVTQHLHDVYPADDSLLRAHPEKRLCASAVIYSKARSEIWMVGDCLCMVDGQLHENSKPYEERAARCRAEVFAQCVAAHDDMVEGQYILHDYAREQVLPMLIESMKNQNVTYAVIDGFPVYKAGIKTVSIVRHPAELILATDGYPFLKPTLRESEAALQDQLANDPFNIRTFLATKGLMKGNSSFDDRTYVRLTTEKGDA